MVIGGGSGKSPARVKVWTNKAAGEISFDNAARRTPTQAWDLAEVGRKGPWSDTNVVQPRGFSLYDAFPPHTIVYVHRKFYPHHHHTHHTHTIRIHTHL